MSSPPSTPPPAAGAMLGITCPCCGCRHLPVLYTRQLVRQTMRVRQCRHCGRRVKTYEKSFA
ncbi:MAG: hypothetical protein JXB62_09630 [Pirellulales bacterium]|nr:hypothetical protein [Pirellulales bacterium]